MLIVKPAISYRICCCSSTSSKECWDWKRDGLESSRRFLLSSALVITHACVSVAHIGRLTTLRMRQNGARERGCYGPSCATWQLALGWGVLGRVVSLVAFVFISASLFAEGGGCGGAGGGGGFGGFGGDSGYPFELPKVEEDVDVAGVTLKLNRNKWGYSVFGESPEGPLARFAGEDIEVTLRRIASPSESDRALAETLSAEAGVLYARRVSTSGAIPGVKAAYGRRQSAWADQTKVRYFLKVAGPNWLCFEARPTGKAPQWQDANDLILGAKLDRSRS